MDSDSKQFGSGQLDDGVGLSQVRCVRRKGAKKSVEQPLLPEKPTKAVKPAKSPKPARPDKKSNEETKQGRVEKTIIDREAKVEVALTCKLCRSTLPNPLVAECSYCHCTPAMIIIAVSMSDVVKDKEMRLGQPQSRT